MREPYTINLQEGQSVIIYHNGKVIIKKTFKECRSVFTAWDSFVGTDNEVNAEIIRLKLTEVKQNIPVIKQPKQKESVSNIIEPISNIAEPTSSNSVGIVGTVTNAVSSVWNKVTSIFTITK